MITFVNLTGESQKAITEGLLLQTTEEQDRELLTLTTNFKNLTSMAMNKRVDRIIQIAEETFEENLPKDSKSFKYGLLCVPKCNKEEAVYKLVAGGLEERGIELGFIDGDKLVGV